MSTEKTEGIVIRQTDFSETSRVVSLFTRDWGKISAIAKGARRLKGPFEAAIDLLTRCRIVFIRKSSGGLDILTEAQLISRFTPTKGDLVRLYGGYYVAELLGSLTEEYDPHPVLYDEAVRNLDRLASDEDPRLAIVRFELVILREIGQLPVFDLCVACGEPVKKSVSYSFWVSQGGLICPKCQRGDYKQHQLQPGTVALLERLSAVPDSAIQNLNISQNQYRELRHLLNAFLAHVIGHRPKLLRYLQF